MSNITEAIKIYEDNGKEIVIEFNQDGTLSISSIVSSNNQLSDDQVKTIKLNPDSHKKLAKYLCQKDEITIK